MQILAIETSCDETAAAVIEKNGHNIKILSNVVASQIEIHKKFGGVFPEHASRAHVEKIIPVVEEALRQGLDKRVKGKAKNYFTLNTSPDTLVNNIDYIAVTTGHGLIGSLLIGVNFAKTLAYAKNIPIIGINHWLGHIYSNFTSHSEPAEESVANATTGIRQRSFASTQDDNLPQFPALVLIVSGGHTGLVLMKSHNEIIPLGETLDDAAGEAFDKVAKLLDLGYPGGPAISKAAENMDHSQNTNGRSHFEKIDISLPRPMIDSKDYNFSFSGLKTAVLYKAKQLNLTCSTPPLEWGIRFALAAEFQQAVIDILVAKTIKAAYEFKPKSICLCGGVSANKELREQLKKAVQKLPWKTSYHIPPMDLTGDNAAMIGLAAAYHLDQKTTYDKISADSNLKL